MLDDYNAFFSDDKLKNIRFLFNAFIPPSQNLDHGEVFNLSGLYYRPMLFIISMLSYLILGHEPYGYHLLNLFLFTLMCFTLYVFINQLFRDKALALITSILFAVHPINVLYVNYNTSTIESLKFIFMFLSIIFFLKNREGEPKRIYYLLSLICFGVALLCHETSFVLPFYILFLSIYVSNKGIKEAILKTWGYFLILSLFLIFLFHCTHLRDQVSTGPIIFNLHGVFSIIATFSKLIYLYFTKLLFPDFIMFDWNIFFIKEPVLILIWASGLFVLLLGWLILLRSDAKSMPFFCATWILLGFLPVAAASMTNFKLGLIIEPHWLTFSCIGFFLFIAWAGLKLYGHLNKMFLRGLFVVVLIVWGLITHYNNWIWGDQIRFYDFWLANMDSNGVKLCLDDLDLGYFYLNNKNVFMAQYFFRKAVKHGTPKELAIAYDNLGLLDFQEGNLNKAKGEYFLSIVNNPYNAFALNNLTAIYLNQQNYKVARVFALEALKENKYSVEARLNLALTYVKESKFNEAIKLYQENLDIVPFEEQSLFNLVHAYAQIGNLTKVKECSQLMIEHSRSSFYLTQLGGLLDGLGQFLLSFEAFDQAVHIDPEYSDAYLSMGNLFAGLRKYKEAIHIWQIGQGIAPKELRFKENIKKLTTMSH